MTSTEQTQFLAALQIGSKITAQGMTLVVTAIGDTRISGYSEYVFKKWGRKDEMSLAISMLSNPHYCKDIKHTA